ncbi:hypothetical protein KAT59_03620 [Candidatus Bipolaricaulota bacterium]|nr:hypothetical protein [Candidatus Bipolaricaulota bacterium]MCK4682100.1 hypothetical protein [Candidatus Bipolaricaulota bacterium]
MIFPISRSFTTDNWEKSCSIMSRTAPRTVPTLVTKIIVPDGRWRFNLLYDLKPGLHWERESLG